MDISYCTLEDVGRKGGAVVVIDVLRAYTTAAVALAAGAGPYELVSTLEQAYARRHEDPAVKLLGEVDGYTADGFDFGNSPTAIHGMDLTGVAIVHRSSAGTQGVVRATAAARVLTASFAVAAATARALAEEEQVTFCLTGADARRDGEEDRACAEYIAALLRNGPDVDPGPYVARVATSTAGASFLSTHRPDLSPQDVVFAQVVDRFDFAMRVRHEGARNLLSRQNRPPDRADPDRSTTHDHRHHHPRRP
ncbi:MAG TPA: 2-phosphosulfolactate phosphatase [Euzebya sp.]|nr:2-phosphosulfolactate phosphatase [Euzebya sp.]